MKQMGCSCVATPGSLRSFTKLKKTQTIFMLYQKDATSEYLIILFYILLHYNTDRSKIIKEEKLNDLTGSQIVIF